MKTILILVALGFSIWMFYTFHIKKRPSKETKSSDVIEHRTDQIDPEGTIL